MPAADPKLSVIVATRNRAGLLGRMLRSLDGALAAAAEKTQVIIADSASTDDTPEVIEGWASEHPNTVVLRIERPGKSRALNAALHAAAAELLAFTDDDVELDRNWIAAISAFFRDHPYYAAAMGRISTPAAVRDRETLAQVAAFGTIPLYDRGGAVCDTKHLYGCHMVLRRATLERVGNFDEALGPGASGLHEDGDMARRILRAGMRIGYMPGAVVYHAVEADRLTMEFFRELHRRDARSRFVMNPARTFPGAAAHWIGSVLALTWWTAMGNRRRRMKALGRVVSHTEMLRLVRRKARSSQ